MKVQEPLLLFVDLFCGAGGVTEGIHKAVVKSNPVAKVIACVNHDPLAIESHASNHPDVLHFTEDIKTLDLTELIAHLTRMRIMYPLAKICLWASLECTNFSKAKGGMARDGDSRTMAHHLFRYIDAINPDFIFIENVEEFMAWGPLDENGKPLSRHNGIDYMKWINKVKKNGFNHDYRLLNAADFGALTSRVRYFGIFARKGLKIPFPQPTHAKVSKLKKNKNNPLFQLDRPLAPWRPVKEVLDFEDEGNSIINRKRPLKPKSIGRVNEGCYKYIGNGKESKQLVRDWYQRIMHPFVFHPDYHPPFPELVMEKDEDGAFIAKYYSGRPENKVNSIHEPSPTVTTVANLSLIQPAFLLQTYAANSKGHNTFSIENPARSITTRDATSIVQPKFMVQHNGGDPARKIASIEDPARTITGTGGNLNIVNCNFMTLHYSNGGNLKSVEDPAPTLTTKERCQLITAQRFWLDKAYSGKDNHQSVEQPCGTLLQKDKYALMGAHFIDRQFSTGGQNTSIDQPAGSILPVPKMSLVTANRWLLSTHFGNVGSDLNDPSPAITANRKWNYLVNPQYGNKGASTEVPCFTLIAGMHKKSPSLVTAESGDVTLFIEEEDDIELKYLKIFMWLYGLVDIKMRMLKIPELKLITGFEVDYILKGTQADQKKFIGNAVPVIMAQKIIEAVAESLLPNEMQLAA